MAHPPYVYVFATHVMAVGVDMDGTLPDKEALYPLEDGGLDGHAVYPELGHGGLFVPPADWAVSIVRAINLGQSVGSAGLAAATATAEIVALANSAGNGPIALPVLLNEQAAPVITFKPTGSTDGHIYIPPRHAIRVKVTGLGDAEQVSCSVMFEKFRDGARKVMV